MTSVEKILKQGLPAAKILHRGNSHIKRYILTCALIGDILPEDGAWVMMTVRIQRTAGTLGLDCAHFKLCQKSVRRQYGSHPVPRGAPERSSTILIYLREARNIHSTARHHM
jgi:hypothetical protein